MRVRACVRVRLRGRLSVRGCASRWAGGGAHAWGVGDWVRCRAARGERWLGAQRLGGPLTSLPLLLLLLRLRLLLLLLLLTSTNYYYYCYYYY